MKKILLLCLCVVAAGCVQAPFRTGSIKINKFDTAGFKTSNPIDVNSRVAEDISGALDAEIRKAVVKESKLKIVDACSDGGYELKGRVAEISTDTDHKYRFAYVATVRKFKVDIQAWFYRCGSSMPMFDITEDKDDEDMMNISEELAEAIVDGISRDPSLIPVAAAK